MVLLPVLMLPMILVRMGAVFVLVMGSCRRRRRRRPFRSFQTRLSPKVVARASLCVVLCHVVWCRILWR